MRAKAECCPTCGRAYPKAKAPAGPIDVSAMSDRELFEHYKRTAPAEDVRFALRAGVSMPADLVLDWTALSADVDSGRIKGTEVYRQLRALQARWRGVALAIEQAERRRIAPIRRWAWMIKVPGAAKHYPMRAACAQFEVPAPAVSADRALAS